MRAKKAKKRKHVGKGAWKGRISPFLMKVPKAGRPCRLRRRVEQGRLCLAGNLPHYRLQAGLECPIRQSLLLLMGISIVTLTQTRWSDLGSMPRPRCQDLRGEGRDEALPPQSQISSAGSGSFRWRPRILSFPQSYKVFT